MASHDSNDKFDGLLQMENTALWQKETQPKIVPAVTNGVQPTEDQNHATCEINDEEGEPEQEPHKDGILYGLEDTPSWYMCILLALQNYLMMAPACAAAPMLISSSLCILNDNPARGYLVTSVFFVAGLVTLFQTAIGIRLPIVQGPSVAILIPLMALLRQPQWRCPEESVLRNMTLDEQNETWQIRIRETQGAIIVASLLEVLLGATGAVGLLLRWITPLVITPVITMIGLSLSEIVAEKAGSHWGISALCIILIVIMSQYLKDYTIPIPIPGNKDGTGARVFKFPIFALFPVIIAIILSWMVCVILTATNVFKEGNQARTDKDISLVHETPWFYFPYPGQFGTPTFSAGAIVGVMAGILASTIESVGDYYACARLSEAPSPPSHAINRGILIEGLGSIVSGCYGTGCGVTSFSSNIAVIGITRVASRRVVQTAAALMLLSGVIGKVGAVFVTMPDAVEGGIFVCIVGMIAAVGLSTLQYVDLHSSRNLFVLGMSIFFSQVCHDYLVHHPKSINTGSFVADNIINILLKTTMFSGGLIGFILDNTVPGTPEERGLTRWQKEFQGKKEEGDGNVGEEDRDGNVVEDTGTYEMPCMKSLRRWSWTQYVPFCPTFRF